MQGRCPTAVARTPPRVRPRRGPRRAPDPRAPSAAGKTAAMAKTCVGRPGVPAGSHEMGGLMTTTTETRGKAQSAASTAADEGKRVGQVTGEEVKNVAGEAAAQVRNLAEE